MTALWRNDSLTFTFCMTLSNIIPNWTFFVKEVFWSNALFRKWRNDCIMTKLKLNFPFLSSFNPWAWNHHLDISLSISGYIWSSQAKSSSVIAIWTFLGLTDWRIWARLRGAFTAKIQNISYYFSFGSNFFWTASLRPYLKKIAQIVFLNQKSGLTQVNVSFKKRKFLLLHLASLTGLSTSVWNLG